MSPGIWPRTWTIPGRRSAFTRSGPGSMDEMFRDLKTHLGLEESRVADVERLERLMVGLVLAYLVLALVGLFAMSQDFAARVISWGKASFIFLALEYVQGHDPPRGLLHWKGVR